MGAKGAPTEGPSKGTQKNEKNIQFDPYKTRNQPTKFGSCVAIYQTWLSRLSEFCKVLRGGFLQHLPFFV